MPGDGAVCPTTVMYGSRIVRSIRAGSFADLEHDDPRLGPERGAKRSRSMVIEVLHDVNRGRDRSAAARVCMPKP
jgi:hypothetical protein